MSDRFNQAFFRIMLSQLSKRVLVELKYAPKFELASLELERRTRPGSKEEFDRAMVTLTNLAVVEKKPIQRLGEMPAYSYSLKHRGREIVDAIMQTADHVPASLTEESKRAMRSFLLGQE